MRCQQEKMYKFVAKDNTYAAVLVAIVSENQNALVK